MVDFSTIFDKVDNFLWLPVCFLVYHFPSEKVSTLKGKNLLPWEQILSF